MLTLNTNLDEYLYYLGAVVSNYQYIEHDIKLIIAGMRDGKFESNIKEIEKEKLTLGNAINELYDLDCLDNEPYFDKNFYKILRMLEHKRNYYCHQCCTDFAYEDEGFLYSYDFLEILNEIKSDYNELRKFQQNIQSHRIEVLKNFDRV